jgi:hypothetical protein
MAQLLTLTQSGGMKCASLADELQIQDLTMKEQICVNKARRDRAYMSILRCAAMRPSSVMKSRDDVSNELSQFNKRAPMLLKDVTVSVTDLAKHGEGRLIGSSFSDLTFTIQLHTIRNHRREKYGSEIKIGPSSDVMLRCANVGFGEWLLARGCFDASHKERPAEMADAIKQDEFVGIT